MRSSAKTISEYLQSLPSERRIALEKVRKVILKNLPKGYEEAIEWGMITYQIPLSTYPNTTNKKPMMYAALANQKNYMAVYLCSVYVIPGMDKEFREAFKKQGKKLDMGKSCVRFKKLDDLNLDAIADAIKNCSVKMYIENFERVYRRK